MEQDMPSLNRAGPASAHRQFAHPREYAELPRGYNWDEQKQTYCPPYLLSSRDLDSRSKLQSKFGYVFCHRGLYDRSLRILDNSAGAIDNAVDNGLFLQEVDVFDWDDLHKAFVAHDVNRRRVTKEDALWVDSSIPEIRQMPLSTRGIRESRPKHGEVHLSRRETEESEQQIAEFDSVCLTSDETVLFLYDLLWKEKIRPNGITLQLDLRNTDLSKAMAYHSYHLFQQFFNKEDRPHLYDTLSGSMFRPIIFKGYNKYYDSFEDLHSKIKEECLRRYQRPVFEPSHLPHFPPIIMVFYAKYLVKLAMNTAPSDRAWEKKSYNHIYDISMKQISSFIGLCNGSYDFILEIVHSGLGLGYDLITKKARNPLNGLPLKDEDVIFDSLVDRAMIDVQLELKRRHPQLLFSSCTRLSDVNVREKKYKAGHVTSQLERWPEGEKGIQSSLRAIHGGLYPQADLVVADDPAKEIAARTWIDQDLQLDRSKLLLEHTSDDSWRPHGRWRPYNSWLTLGGRELSLEVRKINALSLANTYGGSIDHTLLAEDPGAALDKSMAAVFEAVKAWMGEAPARRKSYAEYEEIEQAAGAAHVSGGIANEDNIALTFAGRYIVDTGRETEHVLSMLQAKADVKYGHGRHIFTTKAGIGSSVKEHVTFQVANVCFTFVTKADAEHATQNAKAYKAAAQGNLKSLQDCISHGAEINTWTGIYGPPLVAACANGNFKIVEFLIGKGADINEGHVNNRPLEIASSKGHNNILSLLLDRGARINSTEESPCAALAKACQNGHLSTVRLLLDKGANVDGGPTFPSLHITPIQAARMKGHKEIFELLLTRGADINKKAENGHSPLFWAYEGNSASLVTAKKRDSLIFTGPPGLKKGYDRAFKIEPQYNVSVCGCLICKLNNTMQEYESGNQIGNRYYNPSS